ncbi:MAG: DUF169 domain-containing protein [Candidatus Abyssubacteria bacterium]
MGAVEKYHAVGKELIEKLKLMTYPVAVRLIRRDEEEPDGAARPLQVFGAEVPACLLYTYCRRSGVSFYMTKDDIACKPIVIYFGLQALPDPDDLYDAWELYGGYKRNAEKEKASRKSDDKLEPYEFKGIAISPLHQTIIEPHLAMIYCSPLVLSHLILAATYEGDDIVSHFNGMESSCKEGIIRTYKTGECQVVSPGMGDRVMAGVQDHEMIFSMPESRFHSVSNNLFLAGNKISDPSPFVIPHATPTLGPNKIFGNPVEPLVWPTLREKLGRKEQ